MTKRTQTSSVQSPSQISGIQYIALLFITHHFLPWLGNVRRCWASKCFWLACQKLFPFLSLLPLLCVLVAPLSICILDVLLQPHPCRLLSLGISLSLGNPVLPILWPRRDQCFNRLLLGKSPAEDLSLNGQMSFRKICLIVLPPRAAGNPFSELRLIQLKNNFVVQRPILYGIITGISCNHQDCLEGKKTPSM